jgi:hypothetical protein
MKLENKVKIWFFLSSVIYAIVIGFIWGNIIFYFSHEKFYFFIVTFSIILVAFGAFGIIQYNVWKKWLIEKESFDKKNDENPLKYRFNITDEDKIIFQHLLERHKNLLSFVDVLDTKFSTAIALNGVILSFTFFRADQANQIQIFVLGLSLIVISILIGIYGYSPRTLFAGMNVGFFKQYDNQESGNGIRDLKDQLILDIERNEKTQNFKAEIFEIMLIINIIGIIILILGYYA